MASIPHIKFKSAKDLHNYYKVHHLIRDLNNQWGYIRLVYPPGIHDGHYILAVMSFKDDREIDVPRALISILDINEDEREEFEGEFLTIERRNATSRVFFYRYLLFESLAEVKNFYKLHKDFKEKGGQIANLNYGNNPPIDLTSPSYIFIAYDTVVGEEMAIPRLVLAKKNCSKRDERFIAKLKEAVYSNDPQTPPAPADPSKNTVEESGDNGSSGNFDCDHDSDKKIIN